MKRAWLFIVVASFVMAGCATSSNNKVSRTEENARIHTDLASEYYRVGQVAVAVQEAEQALASDPKYVPAHTLLALMYAQLRQIDQADAHFATALSLASKNTDLRNSYAWFLCGSGRSTQALTEFSVVLRDPLYGSIDKALTNAGVCAARINRFDLAKSYLNAALDVNPNNGVAHLYRAHVLINEGDFSAASEEQRLAQTNSVDMQTLLWLKIRLAQAQGQRGVQKLAVAQLLREAPTSEEAEWARNERFELF